MEALERIRKQLVETPEVAVPLSWGAVSGGAATLHSYHSIFRGAPTPRSRLLRSVDVGVVVFVVSASLGYLVDRRTRPPASDPLAAPRDNDS